QRDCFGEVLVAAQRSCQRAGDLRHLDRVSEPRTIVVALVGDEDLRLVLQPAEGSRMDDAVAIALERRACGAFGLMVETAARARRIGGIGRTRTVAEAYVTEIGTFLFHAVPPVDLPFRASYLCVERERKVTPMGADVKTGMKVELTDAAAKRISAIVA